MADFDARTKFMNGKAMAALLIRESADHGDGDSTSLVARYRNDARFEPQDCYARQYLQAVIDDPELLEGFAAGLSHGLSACMNQSDSPHVAVEVATATFEECCALEATPVSAAQPAQTSSLRPGNLRVAWSAPVA